VTQQDETTVDDIIWGGGGAKSAEWPHVGAWVGGPIVSRPKKYQPTEYVKGAPAGSGKPRTTRDGRPIYGIRVDVQTTLRDPAVPDDNGIRRLHLDKWRQHDALRNALLEAGVRHLEIEGELWVQWTGEDSESDAGNPAKTWIAKYRPPANSAAGMIDPAPAPVQAPPVQSYGGNQMVPGGMYGSTPVQAPQPPQNHAPAPTPPIPAAMPAAVHQAPPGGYLTGHLAPGQAPQQQAAPPAPTQAPPGPAQPTGQSVLTESVAAALRAQGFDTSTFTIIPD
jgi:hypothetical protein